MDTAKVYFNPSKKTFLLVTLAKRGVGIAEIGEPIVIADEEFDSRIGSLLVRLLDGFEANIYSPASARRAPGDFIRQHLSVTVERIEGGDLIIKPLHHERGGYVGIEGEQVIVPRAEIHSSLPFAVREAFRLAT